MPSLNHYAPALFLHRLYSSAWLDRDGIAELRRQGVDTDLMANLCGPVVRVLATFPGNASFEPDDMGEVAFVIPVMGEDAESHVDVVAWAARDPKTFGTMFGNAGVLGADAILNPASFHAGPCPIWGTPLQWLHADCAGVVVLEAELARATFRGAPAGAFAVDSLEDAHRLIAHGCLTRDRLFVRCESEGVAA